MGPPTSSPHGALARTCGGAAANWSWPGGPGRVVTIAGAEKTTRVGTEPANVAQNPYEPFLRSWFFDNSADGSEPRIARDRQGGGGIEGGEGVQPGALECTGKCANKAKFSLDVDPMENWTSARIGFVRGITNEANLAGPGADGRRTTMSDPRGVPPGGTGGE